MSCFKVGDNVSWESQAAGSLIRKKGKLVAVVPKGVSPRDTDFGKAHNFFMYWGRTTTENYRIMFDGWPRNHESYLVEVPGGKTAKATSKLYWPRISQLKKEAQDGG
jgi:hypothetical protein